MNNTSAHSSTEADSALVDPKIRVAAAIYLRRRERIDHPKGKFDGAQRWYPDVSEGLDTSSLRTPTRAWPYSYLLSCRTIRHCAKLAGVADKATEVRREARMIKSAAALLGRSLKVHTASILRGES